MRTLESISIENFKSIRAQKLLLGKLNVFIGGNGVGKSNLIQCFRFLNEIVKKNLALYSLKKGADYLLYFGRKHSQQIAFELSFRDESQLGNGYKIELVPANDNSMTVASESVTFHRPPYPAPYWEGINGASREAVIGDGPSKIAKYVRECLDSYRVYHFHDTSDSAAVKAPCKVEDNQFLRTDASNLAAFLFRLRNQNPVEFQNIQDTLRQIAPFFDSFDLKPSQIVPDQIRLEWRERGSDQYFDAYALSDGTLRFICLTTLLLQPQLPSIVLIDEPELGLHPAAIELVAAMLRSAAQRTQVIVSTQSVTLVDHFTPEEVWVVEREDAQSVFAHLGSMDLKLWLEDYEGAEGYSLGELWEKNVLGARP
jgi:predicted ATPase